MNSNTDIKSIEEVDWWKEERPEDYKKKGRFLDYQVKLFQSRPETLKKNI